MKRGEIYYIDKAFSTTGSEQMAGRPAIILSNDNINNSSDVVEIVYLTTAPKTDLPTHVTLRSMYRTSIALCEQVTSVSKSRIGDYVGECTDAELEAVDRAVCISLGLETLKSAPVQTKLRPAVTDVQLELEKCRTELVSASRERDKYFEMYHDLLNKILGRN